MRPDQEVFKFLSGEKFRTDYSLRIESKKLKPLSREAAIIEIIRDKSVIHIGCSDHIEIIEAKLRQNLWLHKLITDVATDCIGIDIDRASIDFIKNTLHYENVIVGDILNDEIHDIKKKKWDYALFGEMIEHLDNPVHFLKEFRTRYGKYINKFIVSVPNIYNESQLKNIRDYKEVINSDHRYWFTPYTILKILTQSGYSPEDITFVNRQPLTTIQLVIRKINKLAGREKYYPFYFFRTMIVSGTLS